MLFKNDKKLLKIIRNENPQLPNDFYGYEDIFKISNMSREEYLISLRNLSEINAISFGDESMTAFRLEAAGMYFEEYQRSCIVKYVSDKLIDFLAVVISLIALIVSIA